MIQKIYLICGVLFVSALNLAFGQNPINGYEWSVESGQTYRNLTRRSGAFNGTFANSDEGVYEISLTSANFRFTYCGVEYDTLWVSTNGFISFNSTIGMNSAPTNHLHKYNGGDNFYPLILGTVIAPLWDDLALDMNSAFTYQLEGTAPNRYLVVEWKNAKWPYSPSSPRVSFQARLYEGSSGKITFHYNANGNAFGTALRTASIGFGNGSNEANYAYKGVLGIELNNTTRLSDTGRAESVNKFGSNIETYAFKFQVSSCPAPLNLSIDSVNFDYIGVKWSELAPVVGSNFEFDYALASSGSTPSSSSSNFVANVTSPHNISGLNASTNYKISVRRKCGATKSNWRTINVQTLENCPAPFSIQATRRTGDSLYVSSVLARPGVGSMQIDYGVETPSYVVGAGTLLSPATPMDSLSGLRAFTRYKVSARQICTSGDTSAWKTVTLQTLPNVITSFSEKFEHNDGDNRVYFSNGRHWKVQDSLAKSGDSSLRLKYYPNELNESIYLNYMLDISDASKYQFLSFWHIASMEAVNNGPGYGIQVYDYGQVEISTDSGQTYVPIPAANYIGTSRYAGDTLQFHEASYSGGQWDEYGLNDTKFKKETFNLSSYAGSGNTLMLRFRLKTNLYTSRRIGWAIDDVKFQQTSCVDPVNLRDSVVVAENKIYVKWDTVISSENYEIEYGTQGFTIGSGTRSTVNRALQGTINFSALTANTIYDVYVRAKCSASDCSDWIGPISMTMPPANAKACNAILVNADGSLIQGFNFGVAEQEPGESAMMNHYHTLWYKVIVPASGKLAITACESGIEVRINVMNSSTFNCSNLSTLSHLTSDASRPDRSIYFCRYDAQWERCGGITPGDTLTFTVGSTISNVMGLIKFRVHDQTLSDNPAGNTATRRVCYGDTVNLYDVIEDESSIRTQPGSGTKWSYTPLSTAIYQDSMYLTRHSVTNKDSVRYIVNSACTQDTSYAIIKIVSGSNSGTFIDTLETCNSSWASLFQGLSGDVQMGGTWSDDDGTTRVDENTGIIITRDLPPGVYKFTYKVGGNPCPESSTQIVVRVKNCVGIKENNQDVFRMYPNPTTNGVLYVSSKDLTGKVEIRIMNAQGQIVKIERLNLQTTNRLDINELPAGLYNISIKHGENVYNSSIVVK